MGATLILFYWLPKTIYDYKKFPDLKSHSTNRIQWRRQANGMRGHASCLHRRSKHVNKICGNRLQLVLQHDTGMSLDP